MLRSILIIHNIIYRIDFTYLAELFRFLGILVCEDILVENDGRLSELKDKMNHKDYDALIFAGNKEITEKEAELLGCTAEKYREFIEKLPAETIYFGDDLLVYGGKRPIESDGFPEPVDKYLEGVRQTELLTDILAKVLEKSHLAESYAGADSSWRALIDIYVQNDLLHHSMNLQYYSKLPSLAAEEAKTAFIQGYEQLQGIKNGMASKVLMHWHYALLWCAVKVNNACDYQKDILYFPLKELAEQCRELCEEYDDFTNAKILWGLCYEPSLGSGNEALAVFQNVLKEMGDVCFASPVYYWMGKRYESVNGKEEEAEICYRNANERKEKFRNNYKLAIFERDRKEYEKSLELFNNILGRLEKKLKMDFADPLELEYAFKVYTQKCYIYYQMENYAATIEMGNKAIEIIKEKIEDSRYLDIFYNDRKRDYIDIMKKRLSLKTVYQLLMETYRKLLNGEKVNEYKEELKKLEIQ